MISESDLLRSVGATIFTRGESYYKSGSVRNVTRQGQTLTAQVKGTQRRPYTVTITFTAQDEVDGAQCSCPYAEEWSGWCKHIVAALLVALREKKQVSTGKIAPSVNVAAVLSDVEAVFEALEADPYGEDTSMLDEALTEYTQKAQEYFAQQNSEGALALLETFLIAFLAGLDEFEYDYDEACDFDPLSRALGAALLRANLSESQKQSWLKAVESWHEETVAFLVPLDILRNAPNQLDKLKREERETTKVRCSWLAEQKKWDEALILATLTNWKAQQALCLISLGRQSEAEPLIQKNAPEIHADEALSLVEALQKTDSVAALRIGRLLLPYRLVPDESGLCDYEYGDGDLQVQQLARLVQALATAQSVPEGITEALHALLLAGPTLPLWKEYAALAAPDAQNRLLQRLAKTRQITPGVIEILLAGQSWSAAWSAAQRCYTPGLKGQVASTVVAYLPNEVRDYARKLADPIMNNNKASEYESAAFWLARERDADIALGQGKRWNERLALLRQQNARKYKLMPLLNALASAPEDETPPPPPPPPTERKRLIFKVS